MKLAPVLVAALVLAPLALTTVEAVTTLHFSLVRPLGGAGGDLRTFTVPSWSTVLCYVRWIETGSNHVAGFTATLQDGSGRVVVVDTAASARQGLFQEVTPVGPVEIFPVLGYVTGTFTFTMPSAGTAGGLRFQVYSADSPSECGTLPPPSGNFW